MTTWSRPITDSKSEEYKASLNESLLKNYKTFVVLEKTKNTGKN